MLLLLTLLGWIRTTHNLDCRAEVASLALIRECTMSLFEMPDRAAKGQEEKELKKT
jgi:hypothetical protein